ncbi:hypothetical protein C0J52_18669 [Blattella germanica]|nr:hypothetical protein C0J52_18669 [Blattella germanica]
MADVDFVIPSNKDELLQSEPGQYCVNNVSDLRDLSDRLSGFGVLANSLQMILEEGEMDNEMRLKIVNITKMTTYILTQMMRGFEDKLSQKGGNGVLIDTGKGRKKTNKKPEYDDFNWEAKSHGALVQIYNMLQLPLNKLWDPPIAEEEFVNLIADCCYKAMEDPGIAAAKLKYVRETMFQVLGILIKRYNHGLSCSIKILLKLYDHLVSPLAQGVVQLVKEFGSRSIVRELVREIGETDSADLMQDTSGTRAYSQFLVEVAESVPELILPAINMLTVHLNGESPAMRMCVLGIMGEIVLRMLSVESLDENSRDLRDEFLDHLEDHLHDVNAFVRVKVLKLVVGRLQDKSSNVKKNALQLVTTFLEGNPFAAKLKLEELEAQHKKEAQKLETLEGRSGTEIERQREVTEAGREQAWLEREVDIAKTIEEILKTEALEEIRIKLGQKNYSEAYYLLRNAEKTFPGMEQMRCDMEMQEQVGFFLSLLHKIFVECNSSEENTPHNSQEPEGEIESQISQPVVDKAIENQKTVVQYLTFVELVSSAIPVICQLLNSSQPTDVKEAIDFFTSAFQFGMADAIIGVRHMLVLVWSKDQSIKDAVTTAYKTLYFNTESATPRAHAVQVVKNLSGLLKIVDYGQQLALEETTRQHMSGRSNVAVFCELKRRNALREARDEARSTKSSKKGRKPKNSNSNSSHISTNICSNPNKYKGKKIQTAASLTLAKMMMVSSSFCEDHLQLLVTILEKSTDPVTRCNLIVALGDLSYRFPNITEPWTPHVYGRLRDTSCQVRKYTMMVLTHLIMNDMVKVKDMARVFFTELASKGNALYNVMPDIISRLSTPDLQLEENKFRTIMKFIMGLIQKDKQMESLVEKLCLRFRISQSERQWCDLAYCLSLVQYSERSFRRLHENLPCYADKLHSPEVFDIFCNIVASISKSSKPEMKVKHRYQRVQSLLQNVSFAVVKIQILQILMLQIKNHGSKSHTRQSARIKATGKPPPQPIIESDDSDEDLFVKPKAPAPKNVAPKNSENAAEESSSDEDLAENTFASPARKKHCSKKSETPGGTPQTRSSMCFKRAVDSCFYIFISTTIFYKQNKKKLVYS